VVAGSALALVGREGGDRPGSVPRATAGAAAPTTTVTVPPPVPSSGPRPSAEPVGRPAEPVPGQYVVALAPSQLPALAVATAIADDHHGRVLDVYDSALHGFAVAMADVDARALARDSRVTAVFQDALVHADGTQSPAPWNLDRIDQAHLPLDGEFATY